MICRERALPLDLRGSCRLEGLDLEAVQGLLESTAPWAAIHPAREGGTVSRLLAQACAERGIPLLILSPNQAADEADRELTDQDIFHQPTAAKENEAEAAHQTLGTYPLALVVRTDVCFGPWDDDDLVWAAVRALVAGKASGLPADRVFTLTYLPDLVTACLDLLLDGETGVEDLANASTLDQRTFDACALEITSHAQMIASGRRLEDVPPLLSAAAGDQPAALLPPWQSALRHLIHTRTPTSATCHPVARG